MCVPRDCETAQTWMAARRPLLVPLLLILFIHFYPESPRSAARIPLDRSLDQSIRQEQHDLAVIQNSTFAYTPFDAEKRRNLNLTISDPGRDFAWDAFAQVQDRARKYAAYVKGPHEMLSVESMPTTLPLYRNVSGSVRGTWVRSPVEVKVPTLNRTQYAPQDTFGHRWASPFEGNVTTDQGEVSLRFRERPRMDMSHEGGSPDIVELELEMSLGTGGGAEQHTTRMLGVYFPLDGHALLATTSDKFPGIFMLPHLALSEDAFDRSKTLLGLTIGREIQRQINHETMRLNPWTSMVADGPEHAIPSCDMVVYLQQLPLTAYTAPAKSVPIEFLEQELRFPTGALISGAPDLHFSLVVFSPDCGFILESKGPPHAAHRGGKHLTGLKVEVFHARTRRHLLAFFGVISAQIAALIRQMRESCTPSTRSRISLYTVALLSLGDGFAFLVLLLTSLLSYTLWTVLVATAFLCFISAALFDMRFLMDIWVAQAPERERAAREQSEEERRRYERIGQAIADLRDRQRRQRATHEPQSSPAPDEAPRNRRSSTTLPVSVAAAVNGPPATGTPASPEITERTDPGSLPLPATVRPPADTGATPVFMPSDQEGLLDTEPAAPTLPNAAQPTPIQSFGALYTRFYLVVLGTLFLSINALTWPPPFRKTYFLALALLYLSFWLPQITRNIARNCRHALTWEFVLAQTALRLAPFAYIFAGLDATFLFPDPDPRALAAVLLWSALQLLVLASQHLLGPRWFVPAGWAPPAYDYHPVLRHDAEDASLPIGSAPAHGPATRLFDCAICMQDLVVPVLSSSDEAPASAVGLLARRAYMVTPCRHVFHTGCLEGWMKYRLQCPICREQLPTS